MNAWPGSAARESPQQSTCSDRPPPRAEWLIEGALWRKTWFVPFGTDPARFVDPDGGPPPLHLVADRRGAVAPLLRLCEDSTGLLVAPTDPRLPAAGIWVPPICSEHSHPEACRGGDFRPGRPIRLIEVDSGLGPSTLAVTAAAPPAVVAAFVVEPAAQALIGVLDSGGSLTGVGLRGTGVGEACRSIAVLVASADVVAHLLGPRPPGLPEPMHLRAGAEPGRGGVTMGGVHYRPPHAGR